MSKVYIESLDGKIVHVELRLVSFKMKPNPTRSCVHRLIIIKKADIPLDICDSIKVNSDILLNTYGEDGNIWSNLYSVVQIAKNGDVRLRPK